MPRVFNHIEDYLDNHNKVNDLHIGGEITSGDKGIIYSISNDPTKVILNKVDAEVKVERIKF
jgi:hypothetical protein